MSKLVIEPIRVQLNGNRTKMSFIWRNKLYRVENILAWWREPADWWKRESIKCFLRVNARNSSTGTYELFKEGDSWFLYRVLD